MNRWIKKGIRRFLPRALSRQRILGGPLRGLALVTSWHDYPAAILGSTERPLLEWFRNNVQPGEIWLDIGAHYGYTAIALCRLVGKNGRVYAFEPMLATAGCIAQTKVLNGFHQLTILPIALGDGQDFAIKRLPEVRGMIDSTLVSTEKHWGNQPLMEEFLGARLDWLWPRICDQTRSFHGVKIDVQGMEIEVIRGMAESLRAHRPKLAVEVHSGVDRELLLDLLASCGYRRAGIPIEPIEGEIMPLYLDNRSYAFDAK